MIASLVTVSLGDQAADPSTVVHEAYAVARKAWPDVPLSYEQFDLYLSRLGSGDELWARAAELYLCAACAVGQQSAYRAIEKAYFPKVRATIYRVVKDTYVVGDVLQEIRSRLFVGHPPKIATYRGSGSLNGWLGSIAVRASRDYLRAATMHRKRIRRLSYEQRATRESKVVGVDWADERPFRSDGARLCEQAWWSAVRSLDSMEKQLLHHHFVSGLSIDVLGPLYSVHRATIARRLRRTIDRMRERVRASLSRHYPGWTRQDLDALALGVCRDLDITASLLRVGIDA